MSMPIIVNSGTTKCEAVADLVESIALQQTGLSHILNAEGEKIQAVLAMENVTSTELLAVNDSVKDMVEAITNLEFMLQGKLRLVQSTLEECSTCTAATLELSLNNADSGTITMIDSATYSFTGNDLEANILFSTTPDVSVTLVSILPEKITFEDNTLIIPAGYDYTEAYSFEFKIGDDECAYNVILNTTII